MEVEKINKTIKELREKIDLLENEVSMVKKGDEWPKVGDNYFLIADYDYDYDFDSSEYDGDETDRRRALIGNMFKTEEEARKKFLQLKARAKLIEIIDRDYGGQPSEEEWRMPNMAKYCMSYNSYSDKFFYGGASYCIKGAFQIYARKKLDVSKVIEEMGDLAEGLK